MKSLILIGVIIVMGIFGYASNVYRLCNLDFDTPLKAEVIRGVGVFVVPLGSIIGYMDIEDK